MNVKAGGEHNRCGKYNVFLCPLGFAITKILKFLQLILILIEVLEYIHYRELSISAMEGKSVASWLITQLIKLLTVF